MATKDKKVKKAVIGALAEPKDEDVTPVADHGVAEAPSMPPHHSMVERRQDETPTVAEARAKAEAEQK